MTVTAEEETVQEEPEVETEEKPKKKKKYGTPSWLSKLNAMFGLELDKKELKEFNFRRNHKELGIAISKLIQRVQNLEISVENIKYLLGDELMIAYQRKVCQDIEDNWDASMVTL